MKGVSQIRARRCGLKYSVLAARTIRGRSRSTVGIFSLQAIPSGAGRSLRTGQSDAGEITPFHPTGHWETGALQHAFPLRAFPAGSERQA